MKIRKLFKIFILVLIVLGALNFNDSKLHADGSWSSYGRLAYVSYQTSSTADSDIIVWDADTDWENGRKYVVRLNDVDQMDECNEEMPALSQNGYWLAFATDCDYYGHNPDFKWWIGIVNLENPEEWYPITIGSEKVNSFNSMNPTWDPTGGKLAFDSDIRGERNIFFVSVYDQIEASAAGKLAEWQAITDQESWDPSWGPDGAVLAVMTPEGAGKVWADEGDSISIISQHSGHESDHAGSPIVIRGNFGKSKTEGSKIINNWRIPGLLQSDGQINCDPRAEFFAYHTDGHVSGDGDHDFDDGTSKIIVTCEHNLDKETPKHVTEDREFATYQSNRGGTGCCIALFPEVSPDGKGMAYLQDNGQIMVTIYNGDQDSSAPFSNDNNVRIDNISYVKDSSPLSWSRYETPLPSSSSGEIEIGVGALGLKVDVGGGVNEIFKQEDSLEEQYDRQIQLEIKRINSYIAELEYVKESNLKMLNFEIESWMQNYENNNSKTSQRIDDTKYQWEFNLTDLKSQRDFDIGYFEEDYQYNLINMQDNFELWKINEYQRQLDDQEANQQREISETEFYRAEVTGRTEYDYAINKDDIARRWDQELVNNDNWYNQEIGHAQRDGDQEYVNYLFKEKERAKQDILFTKENDLDNSYNEYQNNIWNNQNNWEFEDSDRKSRFAQNKAQLIQSLESETQRKENDIQSYITNMDFERESRLEGWNYNIENYEMQMDAAIEDAVRQVEYEIQSQQLDLERMQMQWDLRKEQITADYDNQLRDFENQIEQVIFQAEIEKQRLSMDQAQLETEMMQMQNELSSRQSDADRFYENAMNDLNEESTFRLEELENNKQSEGWSDEVYQERLSEFDQWFFQRQFEIQSQYDDMLRNIDFDQRQYENLQTVIDTNEVYQDGERGFFGNPLPGSVRQGGIIDNLSDPGNLAMIGIIVTVAATLLQLARGK